MRKKQKVSEITAILERHGIKKAQVDLYLLSQAFPRSGCTEENLINRPEIFFLLQSHPFFYDARVNCLLNAIGKIEKYSAKKPSLKIMNVECMAGVDLGVLADYFIQKQIQFKGISVQPSMIEYASSRLSGKQNIELAVRSHFSPAKDDLSSSDILYAYGALAGKTELDVVYEINSMAQLVKDSGVMLLSGVPTSDFSYISRELKKSGIMHSKTEMVYNDFPLILYSHEFKVHRTNPGT